MSDTAIFISNPEVIVNGDMSANITSTSIEMKSGRYVALHAEWTGTSPVGTLALNGSNDGVNFRPLLAASAVSGNSGGLIIYPPCGVALAYINAFYTRTSGTGTLNVYISIKE